MSAGKLVCFDFTVSRRSWRAAAAQRLPAVLSGCAMLFALAVASFAAAAEQLKFPSAEAATDAFVAALAAHDVDRLSAILGPDSKDILESGDPAQDRLARERFSAAYAQAHKLKAMSPTKATILVGSDDWPFPVLLIKEQGAWRFDAREGREELVNRRIGRNELWTLQSVLAYVDAQREYYARNPQNERLLQYAQKFVSSEGKRDGLYFETAPGEKPSPLGPLFDAQRAAGYIRTAGGGSGPTAYHGYYYKILTAQGPNARTGAHGYLAKDKMIGGFALVAYPAAYGSSGVMSFIVNYEGVVYEKDLGPQTAQAAQQMTRYDPDKTWKRSTITAVSGL